MIGPEEPIDSDLEDAKKPKLIAEGLVMILVNNIKLIAVYQPESPNEEAIDEYRRILDTAIACKKNKMLLIGGDQNTQVGWHGNTGRETIIWAAHNTAAREDIIEWAQLISLRIVDTNFQKKNWGSWCHNRTDKRYEFNYFFTRKDQNLLLTDAQTVPEDHWCSSCSKNSAELK